MEESRKVMVGSFTYLLGSAWFLCLCPLIACALGFTVLKSKSALFVTGLPGFLAAACWLVIVNGDIEKSKQGVVTGYGFGYVLILLQVFSGILSIAGAFAGAWLRKKLLTKQIPAHERGN